MGIKLEIFSRPDPTELVQNRKPIVTHQFGPENAYTEDFDLLILTETIEGHGPCPEAQPVNYLGDKRNVVRAYAEWDDHDDTDRVVIRSSETSERLKALVDGKFEEFPLFVRSDASTRPYKARLVSVPNEVFDGQTIIFLP